MKINSTRTVFSYSEEIQNLTDISISIPFNKKAKSMVSPFDKEVIQSLLLQNASYFMTKFPR